MSGHDTHPNLDKVIAEYLKAVEAGNVPDRDELVSQHSDLADDLESFFANHDAMQQAADELRNCEFCPLENPPRTRRCSFKTRIQLLVTTQPRPD